MNETLTLALENYHGFPLSHHPKRGFFDGIGHLSGMLFGTAMNKDVEELRNRYSHLALLASAHNKAIRFNSKHTARLEQHVYDIAFCTTTLRLSLNNVLTTIKSHYDLNVVGVPVLENTVNSLLRTNALVIQNVVDAARGRVTSLFPVKDFLKTLETGETEYQLTPLFDLRSIHYYYPLLESFLTSDVIVIHVPFKSQDEFEEYRLEPFPFSLNQSIVELDLHASVVMVRSDIALCDRNFFRFTDL